MTRKTEPDPFADAVARPTTGGPGRTPWQAGVAVPEYRPFPVEVLPPVMREVVGAVARAIGCDPAYPAVPALVVAGAALAVSPKKGFLDIPALWGVVVGHSGTAKSPAADPFAAAAHAVEDGLEARYAADLEAYHHDAEARGDADRGRPPPAREYFVADDITVERLVENLKSSPRGVLLVQDELANWFASFTRYKAGGRGSDVAKWLNMFDGRAVSYQRRTGHPRDVRVKRAAVSVTGGIQPDILRAALSDPAYIASGLAARLVFAMPPKVCPRWTEAEADPDAIRRFRDVVEFLRAIPFDPVGGPLPLSLEVPAKVLFVAFSDSVMARAEDLDGGPLATALPKLARIGLRLALIHHSVTHAAAGRDPGRFSITEGSMRAGVALAEWFGHEAERVYAMLAETPEDQQARGLVELVRRKGGAITPRGLLRTNNRRYRSVAHAEAALDGLVSAGWGEWEEGGSGPQGGRPPLRFVLRPTPDADRDGGEPG